MLQLLGEMTPYMDFAPRPHWGISVPQITLLHAPNMKS